MNSGMYLNECSQDGLRMIMISKKKGANYPRTMAVPGSAQKRSRKK